MALPIDDMNNAAIKDTFGQSSVLICSCKQSGEELISRGMFTADDRPSGNLLQGNGRKQISVIWVQR
jgi:hypothetical protein